MDILEHPSSTIGTWAIMIAKVLDNLGSDSLEEFASLGINLHHLRKNNVRVSNQKIYEIWKVASTFSNDPYISLYFAKMVRPFALNVLGMCMEVSQYGHEALTYFSRHASYLNDDLNVHFINQQEIQLNSHSNFSSPSSHLNTEALLGSLTILLQSIHKDIKPKEVYLRHICQGDKAVFEDFFGCTVFFNSEKNALIFDRNCLFEQGLFSNPILANLLEGIIKSAQSKEPNMYLSDRVRAVIIDNKTYRVEQKDVAKKLNLSCRNLQRKLKSEGVSYKDLLDECRKKKAQSLLSDNDLPLSEMSDILGFDNASNFSRAFKRWHGSTPGQYRKATMCK